MSGTTKTVSRVVDESRTAAVSVEALGVSKSYRGAQALRDVSISIRAGEIHSLVGENGAGKSTLGKIIAGVVPADEGEIHVNGRPVKYRSPRDAIRLGIAMIDQELALAPQMSVLDNVFLGAELTRAFSLDRSAQRERFRELADRVGLPADPMRSAGSLRVAEQQQVEIIRALVRGARLIVMDEPTAALSRSETDRLLALARELRDDDGVTLIFVSHFLDEVLSLSDTVTVLKDGRRIKTSPAKDETAESLVTSMLGRSMDVVFPPRSSVREDAPIVLKVEGLNRPPMVRDVTFELRAGEIVGLAGLVGSGRTEIARAIFGADRAEGEIQIEQRSITPCTPSRAIKNGIALLPESRKEQGLAMQRPISENVTMAHLGEVTRYGVISRSRERDVVNRMLKRVDARAASPKMAVSGLSGGNQQKVALSKWLVRTPRVLIADEPTRGVDIGAKRAIYELIVQLADEGLAVLLISSELEETLRLAHRILVVRGGSLVAEFSAAEANEEAVLRAAFGNPITHTDGGLRV